MIINIADIIMYSEEYTIFCPIKSSLEWESPSHCKHHFYFKQDWLFYLKSINAFVIKACFQRLYLEDYFSSCSGKQFFCHKNVMRFILKTKTTTKASRVRNKLNLRYNVKTSLIMFCTLASHVIFIYFFALRTFFKYTD